LARTAVQFGAGNIGRGFLAQLFHESGLVVLFVDVASQVINAINARGEYTINIVGDGACRVTIDQIRGLRSTEVGGIAAAIAAADTEIVCTAVGAVALPLTAPAIAAGIERRYRAGNGPINVLLCENLHNAADVLRAVVSQLLPVADRDSILAETGFVQTVVSRMVPLQTDKDRTLDPLGVRVEAYKRLPVDAEAWVGPNPASSFVGLEAVSPFEAYVERKLFTHNCAHAVLGYLGYAAGHEFGYEALHDSRIEPLLRAVLEETGHALILKHGIDPAEHSEHVADLLRRFDNRELGDTCRRLARDPIRKLAAGDRIVGAARCCESQNVSPTALSWAIAAALRYDAKDDPPAVELQKLLHTEGRDAALKQVCGISPNEPLARLIDEAVDAAAGGMHFS
jgi:mannitol-1-phosphate 5-dehydrogenase